MRKFLVILALAGTLSVPSVVFGEASWYGRLQIGAQSQDGNISLTTSGSRWGITGSSELDGGMTAVYNFEHGITANDGIQDPPRLSYVGVSGGFGTLVLGRINTASGTVRGILDNSWFYGASGTAPRRPNNISYSFSNDLLTTQLDAQYEMHDRDPGMNDLRTVEFGLSVNVSDIGRIGVAHTKENFVLRDPTAAGTTPNPINDDTGWKVKTNTIAGQVSVSGLRVYVGSQKSSSEFVAATGGSATGADTEQKTTYFGFGGGLGDTGLSYLVQWRDVKDVNKPWMIGLYKGLGDGVNLNMEYADNDSATKANTAVIALEVNF